eukprot:15228-Rhodomonas_salina.1
MVLPVVENMAYLDTSPLQWYEVRRTEVRRCPAPGPDVLWHAVPSTTLGTEARDGTARLQSTPSRRGTRSPRTRK